MLHLTHMLSDEVLRKIAVGVDQRTRVACCLACHRLYRALHHPSVWAHARVYAPDTHAVRWLRCMRTAVLRVTCSNAYTLVWFIYALHPDSVTALSIVLERASLPISISMMACIARLSELEHLAIVCNPTHAGCLVFSEEDGVFQKLRSVDIKDTSDARCLEVYFHNAVLPALEEVHLEVRTSDVACSPSRCFPALRSLTYRGSHESYEDAGFDGLRVNSLELDVRTEGAMEFLKVALSAARSIQKLTLRCYVDIHLDTYVDARHVCIETRRNNLTATVVHAVMRSVGALTVRGDPSHTWTVRFMGAGSWHNFRAWLDRVDFNVGLGGTVVVDT